MCINHDCEWTPSCHTICVSAFACTETCIAHYFQGSLLVPSVSPVQEVGYNTGRRHSGDSTPLVKVCYTRQDICVHELSSCTAPGFMEPEPDTGYCT